MSFYKKLEKHFGVKKAKNSGRKEKILYLEKLYNNFDNITDQKCIEWIGSNKKGYGQIMLSRKCFAAHRITYTLYYDKFPEHYKNGKAMSLDHFCRNRFCVNPLHLEHVTTKENVLRGYGNPAINKKKKYCNKGHKFNKKNTYIYEKSRACKICRKQNSKKYIENNRENYLKAKRDWYHKNKI